MAREMRDREAWRAQESWPDWAKRKLQKNAFFIVGLIIASVMFVVLSMCVTGGGA
jgi:hypothetical protein